MDVGDLCLLTGARRHLPRRLLLGLGAAAGLGGCGPDGPSVKDLAAAGPHRRFGDVVRRFSHGATLVDFQVSEAADRVVGLALFDRNIYVWQLSDGRVVNRTPRKLTTSRETIAFINGGRQFVTVPTDRVDLGLPVNRDDPVQESSFSIFDSASGSLIRHVPSWKLETWVPGLYTDRFQNSSGEPNELLASQDGTVLVGLYSPANRPFLTVFDTRDFSRLKTIYFDKTTGTVNNHGALSANGNVISVAGVRPSGSGKSPRWAFLISLQTGKVQSTVGPFPGTLNSISLSPDATLAVMTNAQYDSSFYTVPAPDEKTEVRVIGFAGQRTPDPVDLRTNSVPSVDWSRDGALIVAGATVGREVVLLDAATLSILDTCPAEECRRVRFVGGGGQVAHINRNQVVLRDVV